eukprot:1412650-Prymnesium_polylepis.1
MIQLGARICAARQVALRWDGKEMRRAGNIDSASGADALALSELRAHSHRDLEHAQSGRPH